MTIKHIGYPYDDQIECKWSYNKELKTESFYPSMLKKVKQ